MLGIGSLDRVSRRSLINDTTASNYGISTFYPPITLINSFLKTVKDMDKKQLIKHGMRADVLKMNGLLAGIEAGHDATSFQNDVWHWIMRTSSNMMCDIAVLILQRKNFNFAKKWLDAVGKRLGAPCTLSEQKGRMKLGAAKIAYPGAAMVDLGQLIYTIYDNNDAASIFGNERLAQVVLKLHELFNQIAHAFLGSKEELAARLSYITRDCWIVPCSRRRGRPLVSVVS